MTVDGRPAVDPSEAPAHADRWYLEDQREFLRRSLEDADREHDAGDLSDEDHALLVARDTARLAEVERELAALADATVLPAPGDGPDGAANAGDSPAAGEPTEPGQTEAGAPDRRPFPVWRKAGIAVCCLLIVVGAVILVVHFVQARQPGQAESGSISLSQAQQIEQELQQALAYNNQGNTKAALELYNKVLSQDPSNPAALAYAGYLQWNVGSAAHVPSLVRIGRAEIQTAVKDSPTYDEGHLFYGLVLANQDRDFASAVAQFNQFLADDPPASAVAQAAPLVAPAYAALGQPLPNGFAAAAPSSTTSTTSTTTPTSGP
jgi:tetratricopeptide (TPR) repeat protein